MRLTMKNKSVVGYLVNFYDGQITDLQLQTDILRIDPNYDVATLQLGKQKLVLLTLRIFITLL